MPIRITPLVAALSLLVASPIPAGFAQPPAPDRGPAREEEHPPSLSLWPNGAPGSEARRNEPERVEWREEPDITFPAVYNVHNPSITPFLPAAERATGAAVIIAPGGGHSILTTDREGYYLGRILAERGVAAFVLKYRLAHDRAGNSPYHIEDAVADARRAIRVVRSRAEEWHLRPDRIGLLGFSAGGEVTLLATAHAEGGRADAADPIDRVSARPDFFAPIYPGGLEGLHLSWSHDTPPAFLACATDDRMPEQLAELYLALRRAGVNAELHIYNRGGHGFGVRRRPLAVTGWSDRFVEWLADRGFLAR